MMIERDSLRSRCSSSRDSERPVYTMTGGKPTWGLAEISSSSSKPLRSGSARSSTMQSNVWAPSWVSASAAVPTATVSTSGPASNRQVPSRATASSSMTRMRLTFWVSFVSRRRRAVASCSRSTGLMAYPAAPICKAAWV